MNKILKLKTIALFFAMLSLLNSQAFAESVAQFESNIINKYYKTSQTDRENEGQSGIESKEALLQKIQSFSCI